MKQLLFALLLVSCYSMFAYEVKPDEKIVYKSIDGHELELHLFYPENHSKSDKTPAIVFFHGGGWNGGAASQFYNQSAYFASRGLVSISVEYRVNKQHGTTPIESVKDAKSAMRFIWSNAGKFGIDREKIVAGGGSAGGHLAAATATLDGFNEEGEDTAVSCIPKALVLFNPVADNSKEGYGFKRVEAYWEDFSPAHNLKEGTAPTLIMLGTKDTAFKPHLAKKYQEKMEQLGNRCDLILYQDQVHAFFNVNFRDMHFQTIKDADIFLTSLGYLQGAPTVDSFREKLFPEELEK